MQNNMTGKSWWKLINKIMIKPVSCVAALSCEVGCGVLLISKNAGGRTQATFKTFSFSRSWLGRIAKLLTLSQALHQSCEAGRLHYHGNFKGKENQVWEDLTFRKQSIQNIYLMEQIKWYYLQSYCLQNTLNNRFH